MAKKRRFSRARRVYSRARARYRRGGTGTRGVVTTILYATGIGKIIAGNDGGAPGGSFIEAMTTPDPTIPVGARARMAVDSLWANVNAGTWTLPVIQGLGLDIASKFLHLRSHTKITKKWAAI